jgi:dUTP pyrophosphatase
MQFLKIRDVKTPQYSTEGAMGLDFFIPNDMTWETCTLRPGEAIKIPSGIRLELDPWHALLATNRSSLGAIGLVVGATLIDPDYRGEVHLSVINCSNKDVTLTRGQKLVQFVALEKIQLTLNEITDESKFSDTSRGSQGFGSTGTHN